MGEQLVVERNAEVWEGLYSAGRNDLHYPSENLVRIAARHLPADARLRVLDYGFGTGANLAHLASVGHEMHGVEVAASAAATTKSRLAARGLSANLHVIAPGAALPFTDGFFDAVVTWQVLCYNDLASWKKAVGELERVTRGGGLVIVSTAAPGDVSQTEATPLEGGLYRSRVEGQEGCILTIPDREQLPDLFPDRELEIGEFSYSFGGTHSRHWLIVYRKGPA